MNMEKMKEVFSDKAFAESLLEMDTAAEVQAALKEKGVDVTEEELLSIREMLVKAEDGELSEDALEQVAGGLGELSFAKFLENVFGFECDYSNGRW